jgi:hypothetical protein
MTLGRTLLERNLIEAEQLEQATQRQKITGGSFRDSVVALGLLSPEEVEAVIREVPPVPQSLEETELDPQFLLNTVLKAFYVFGIQTALQAEEHLKLPRDIVETILERAKEMRLVEILGLSDAGSSLYRHTLTSRGREWAIEALGQSQYVGPAPVPFHHYEAQLGKQSVAHERVGPEDLSAALSHLVLPRDTVQRLGPALRSGKAILLYGTPGNGKTSIAEALDGTFEQTIFVPHCIEVDGQVVKIFDPAIHERCDDAERSNGGPQDCDPRWVRCRRPTVITGGELTMEMLDLSFDPVSKIYEAPAHIKATGGIFIIDDFGRQRVSPAELLNRWILPLERRVDFLSLHTGKKLRLPFDEIVVFSTNLPPGQIMDEAMLRRIEYKLEIDAPTPADYTTILRRICEAHALAVPDEVTSYLLDVFYPETGTARSGAHPKFIVEQILARCAFEGVAPDLSLPRVRDALRNLVLDRPRPGNPAS